MRMDVAEAFKVSMHDILGLSTVGVRKSYDISELGLYRGEVKGVVCCRCARSPSLDEPLESS